MPECDAMCFFKCILSSSDLDRDYVILRSAAVEFCHPEGFSTARRIWVVLKASKPGPSRCSGRQPTRDRRYDSVILRSAATKNLLPPLFHQRMLYWIRVFRNEILCLHLDEDTDRVS